MAQFVFVDVQDNLFRKKKKQQIVWFDKTKNKKNFVKIES